MDTRPSTAHAVSPHEAAFINSLPMINDVIRAVCRRGRVSADEEKEFASSVILKLIGNDYQIFRQFRGGTAALRTFLFKVIHRHLMDRRNSEWGRWRPSKPAKALGSAALYLERLVYRDRTNIGDAVALVANSPKWGLSSRAVRSLYAQAPHPRAGRPPQRTARSRGRSRRRSADRYGRTRRAAQGCRARSRRAGDGAPSPDRRGTPSAPPALSGRRVGDGHRRPRERGPAGALPPLHPHPQTVVGGAPGAGADRRDHPLAARQRRRRTRHRAAAHVRNRAIT